MAARKQRINSKEAREIAKIRWNNLRAKKISTLARKFDKIINKKPAIEAATDIATLIVMKKVK